MDFPPVVITGIGVVSPIGIGCEAFSESLLAGRSGIGPLTVFETPGSPIQIAGEVSDFEAKKYVRPRKSLKVMARSAQLGVAASSLAMEDAGLPPGAVDPERFGVVLGADAICYEINDSWPTYQHCMVDGRFDFSRWGEAMNLAHPLGFLKVLPNMIASHVSIANDARGPNNTMHHGELSSLLAIMEAARVIGRGAADVMLAGGASSQLEPSDLSHRATIGNYAKHQDDPAAAMRPFDADRSGQVFGEGAALFVLESVAHAQARRARIDTRLLSWATTAEGRRTTKNPQGNGLRRAIEGAIRGGDSDVQEPLGHACAQGRSTPGDDPIEAKAIRDTLGDVPITAPRSYFGNLSAAAGAMELAASLVMLRGQKIPPTLNYQRADPKCPVNLVCDTPLQPSSSRMLKMSFSPVGQAAAMLFSGAE